jgi:uncharacterized membrane protein
MNNRPKLSIVWTTLDKCLFASSIIILLAIWIFVVVVYAQLPNTIPIHFGASGKPDGYGGKSFLFLLPAIATILFVLLSALNKFPHVFNYAQSITAANAYKLYSSATRMLRWVSLAVVILIGYIVVLIYLNIIGLANGLGIWFVPIIIAFYCFVTIYTIYNSSKKN